MKYTISAALLSAAFLASCSNNKTIINNVPSAGDTLQSRMTGWVTTGDQRLLLARQVSVPFTEKGSDQTLITVDTNSRFQTMEGFGYTLTGGSAFVINRMPAQAKAALLEELFGDSPSSLKIAYLRISIGASDLNDHVFTYNEMPAGQTDPELRHFSLDPDRQDLIPLLREILKIRPDLTILGSPWTPPVWMKDNNSSIGGSLQPQFYDAYARYFVKYIQEMGKEGITVHAITPQNEPLHPGNNPSLLMPAIQQATFIKNHLGPAFRDAGLPTRIIIYDHNCDKPEYPLTVLNDPEARKFIDGSAFHLYAGDISAMGRVHEAYPDKHVYFTEQYTAINSEFSGDLKWHIKNLIIGAPRNWSRTVLEWNLANDASFGPHTDGGCTTCKGGLTIDGANVKRNVAYYIIGHASAFVPPGSVRIASTNEGALPNVAYLLPSGEIALIVLNEGDDNKNFNIKIGSRTGTGSLPAGAAGTYLIRL